MGDSEIMLARNGGQQRAGAWTTDDETRLRSLVQAAHRAGLWIRFYTLNGHDPRDESGGWSPGYNFGSEEAARARWKAAVRAGFDFIAVDQYERFSATLREMTSPSQDIVVKSELRDDDYEGLFGGAFDVRAGTARLQVGLSYTGGKERTVTRGKDLNRWLSQVWMTRWHAPGMEQDSEVTHERARRRSRV